MKAILNILVLISAAYSSVSLACADDPVQSKKMFAERSIPARSKEEANLYHQQTLDLLSNTAAHCLNLSLHNKLLDIQLKRLKIIDSTICDSSDWSHLEIYIKTDNGDVGALVCFLTHTKK